MTNIKTISSITLFLVLLGIVGRMDFDDHIQMERYKCERSNGSWIIENNGDQYCK